MERDMSVAQFQTAASKLGFKPAGFFGYWRLPPPFNKILICKGNGGERRRDQLAYLLHELDRAEKKSTNSRM